MEMEYNSSTSKLNNSDSSPPQDKGKLILKENKKEDKKEDKEENKQSQKSSVINLPSGAELVIPDDIQERLTPLLRTFMEDNFDISYVDRLDLTLPECIFPEDFNLEYLNNFALKEEEDYANNQDKKLSSEQLKSIYLHGTFTVSSSLANFPNTWKMNSLILKGIARNAESMQRYNATGIYVIYNLKYLFQKKGSYFNLISPFENIWKGVLNGVDSIVGHGLPVLDSNKERYHSVIEKKLVKSFLKNNSQFRQDIYSGETVSRLNFLLEEFQQDWLLEEIKLEQEWYDSNVSEDEIEGNLYLKRVEAFCEAIKIKEEFDPLLTLQIKQVLLGIAIFNLEDAETEYLKRKRLLEVERRIKLENNILSKVNLYKDKRLREETERYIKEIESERNRKVFEKLKDHPFASKIFEIYVNCTEDFESVKANLIRKRHVKLASDEVELKTIEYEPFRVVKKSVNGQLIFKLNKWNKSYQSTNYPFWRLVLVFKRAGWIAINVFKYTFNNLVFGMFGLKSVLGQKVTKITAVDPENGAVVEKEKKTIGYVTSKIKQNISNSREKFENKPDTGFFSKSAIRIFNYLYNYFIKGVLLVGIVFLFYVVAITVSLAISTACMLLAFVIALPGGILGWIGSFLFFDMDKTKRCCPLMASVLVDIVFKGILQIVLCIVSFFVFPIVALIFFVFSMILFILRSIYDSLTMLLILIFGRKPKTDSFIASKVSGPSLSEKLFKQIDFETACVLISSELEKTKLDHFYMETLQKIEGPFEENNSKINKFFDGFQLRYEGKRDSASVIAKKKEELKMRVDLKIEQLPRAEVDIRFDATELFRVTNWCMGFLKNGVETGKYGFLWNYFKLPENAYRRLCDKILKNAFGEGILETLDEAIFRIKLDKQPNSLFDNVISAIFSDEQREMQNMQNSADIRDKIRKEYREFSPNLLFDPKCPMFLNLSLMHVNLNVQGDIDKQLTDRDELDDSHDVIIQRN